MYRDNYIINCSNDLSLLKGGCPPSTVFLMNLSISCIDTCIRLGFVHKMLNLSLLCFVREVYVRVVLVVLVSLPFPLLVCSFLGGTLWNVLFIVLVCCLSTIVGFFCVGFSKHEHIFIRGKINEILKKQTINYGVEKYMFGNPW